MSVTPREILDMQADLAERLEYIDSPLSSYLNNHAEYEFGKDNEVSINQFAFVLSGRAYRIGENMNDEIYRRAWGVHDDDEIPSSARFADVPPPRHRGFAVFEKPLDVPEARGRQQLVHSISWGFGQSQGGQRGWMVAMWGDITRDVDEIMAELFSTPTTKRQRAKRAEAGSIWNELRQNYIDSFGRWTPVAEIFLPKDAVVGPKWARMDPTQRAQIIADGDTPLELVPSTYRLLPALWQLLSEERATPEAAEHVPDAPARPIGKARRAVRPEVNVVVLRRPSRPTLNPGSGKRRTHRTWVEGGFERTYWVGPKGAQHPEKRRIGGYWSVSDEALPIKNRPTVHDLRR